MFNISEQVNGTEAKGKKEFTQKTRFRSLLFCSQTYCHCVFFYFRRLSYKSWCLLVLDKRTFVPCWFLKWVFFFTLDFGSTALSFETGLWKCPENGQHTAAPVWSGISSKRKSNQRVTFGSKDHSSTNHIGPHNQHIHSHHKVKELGFWLGCLIQCLLTKCQNARVTFFSTLSLYCATFG